MRQILIPVISRSQRLATKGVVSSLFSSTSSSSSSSWSAIPTTVTIHPARVTMQRSPLSYQTTMTHHKCDDHSTNNTTITTKDKDPQQQTEEEIVQLQSHIRTHYQHANYTAALSVSETVLQKSIQLFGSPTPLSDSISSTPRYHPAVASAYNNIGLMNKMMGHYDRSIQNYQQALLIYQHVVGEDHASYAATLNNIGNLYRAQANDNMNRIHSENNDEQEVGNDNNNDNINNSNNNNNENTHKSRGKTKASSDTFHHVLHNVLQPSVQLNRKALHHFQRAYQIRKVELGEEHVHTITSQTNLGSTIATLILQEEMYQRMKSAYSHFPYEKKEKDKEMETEDTKERKPMNIPSSLVDISSFLSHPSSVLTHRNQDKERNDIDSMHGWKLAEVHLRAALRTAVKSPRGQIVDVSSIILQEKANESMTTISTTTNSTLPLKKDRNSKGKKERRKDVKEKKRLLRTSHTLSSSSTTTSSEEESDTDNILQSVKRFGIGDTSIQTLSAASAAQNLAVFLKSRATFERQAHTSPSSPWNTTHSPESDSQDVEKSNVRGSNGTMANDPMEAYAEAKNLYLGAMRVRTTLLGDYHPDTIATKFSLAELLDVLGDSEGATFLRNEILDTYHVTEKESLDRTQA